MSIRLKKVEWHPASDCRGSSGRILGTGYETIFVSDTKKWHAVWCVTSLSTHDTEEAAKAACEQHALERIREAVEVEADYVGKADEVPDHIPDATKMVGWRDISTAPRDGTMVALLVYCEWDYQPFVGYFSFGAGWIFNTEHLEVHAGWEGGTISQAIRDDEITHWMPLPSRQRRN